jgi:hypothetical protein
VGLVRGGPALGLRFGVIPPGHGLCRSP